jgi:hypothetical protein
MRPAVRRGDDHLVPCQEFVMSRSTSLCVACALALATLSAATVAAERKPAATSGGDQQQIRSAMQAAPARVGADATIVAANPDGSMRTLRKGSNGFTCMADSPSTPGPDPMCMDQAALGWVGAMIGHKTPPTGKFGLMYMLSGGTDASNTDPYATSPKAGNHWIKTGPHVMLVGADPSFYAQYPSKADPDTSAPYVMWPGTPYQHLMVPVK